MLVFVDDSGDGGFKFGRGSTTHLVMAAVVFHEPTQVETLAAHIAAYRRECGYTREFKYNGTKPRMKAGFIEAALRSQFAIRAIVIDKRTIYSDHLRGSPSALKSFAIRMLLTKTYGTVRDAKVVVDGQDLRGFGSSDTQYFMRMVNRESPGTLRAVTFGDSRENVGLQLADMAAGAIRRHADPSKDGCADFDLLVSRTWRRHGGSYWNFRA